MPHPSSSQLDREIAEALAEMPAAGARDVTDRLVQDSSTGPGELPRMVATAKPARELTPTLAAVLASLRARADRTVGSISKALAYSRAIRGYGGKRDHANLIRLIKGGYVRLCEVSGLPPPGSAAHRDSPYGDRYYVLHVGPGDAS